MISAAFEKGGFTKTSRLHLILVRIGLRRCFHSYLSRESEDWWWAGPLKWLYSSLVSSPFTKKVPSNLHNSWFFGSYPGFECSRSSMPSTTNPQPIVGWIASPLAKSDQSRAQQCLFSFLFEAYSPASLNLDCQYLKSAWDSLLSCFPLFFVDAEDLMWLQSRPLTSSTWIPEFCLEQS